MQEEKIKAFVARIVEECEKEGFTVSEALSIPQQLRFDLNDRILGMHKKVGLNGVPVAQGTSGKDADIHLQTLDSPQG